MLVESIKNLGLMHQGCSHVKDVERSCAQACAVTTGKTQGSLPDLWTERLDVKQSVSLMSFEVLAHESRFSRRPLPSEYAQLEGVCELGLA